MEEKPGIVGEFFGLFIDLIKEMWEAFIGVAPKAISFFFWILAAVFILPCVFVAGTIYPKWEKWGEDF